MIEYDAQAERDLPPDFGLTPEQNEADEDDLQAGLNGLAGMVAGARDIDELLAEVAAFAARAIPRVDGAAVTTIHPIYGKLQIHAWAVTAEFVRDIDNLQNEVLHEGPCITCMQTRRAIVSGSLGKDARWPRFGPQAAGLGAHSVLSLPLLIGDQVIGAINSYARDRDAFGEHAVQLGSQFARSAAVSVYNAQLLTEARDRAGHLQRALVSRSVIDQAIGILRSRTGGSAEQAFTRLREISQSENVKLAVVAQQLVDEAVRRVDAGHQQS
jgi:GAF domain-containing protein